MLKQYVISIISDDKPGVVEKVAKVVRAQGGNWLESQLSQLSGKFAGVILIAINAQDVEGLSTELGSLEKLGILSNIDEVVHPSDSNEAPTELAFTASTPDKPGIVQELSEVFTKLGVNVKSLQTRRTSMPYSGNPLFEADGILELPEGIKEDDLLDEMDTVANELGMDIQLRDF